MYINSEDWRRATNRIKVYCNKCPLFEPIFMSVLQRKYLTAVVIVNDPIYGRVVLFVICIPLSYGSEEHKIIK